MNRKLRLARVSWGAVLALGILAAFASTVPVGVSAAIRDSLKSSEPLPDLSGLAWMRDDLFIVVHDAKYRKEAGFPRISLLALPVSLEGVLWHPVDVEFAGEESNDLESAAAIPDSSKILLSESGDNGSRFDRIFLAELQNDAIEIVSVTRWREFKKPHNVEATAVASTTQDEQIFIWAERNSGETSTDINWTKLTLDPFRIGGAIKSVTFNLPRTAHDRNGKPLYSRSVVAMDIDSDGKIYIAATFDPEEVSPTPDNGPFRSVIYRIGGIEGDGIVLDANPHVIAVLDGLKVESLAVREQADRREIFVGSDDENYGGILRVLPAPREEAE